MKQLTKILFLIVNCTLLINNGMGQNLVPNPSFENYSPCPNSTGQLTYTGNWTSVGGSTDYYNSCSPQGNMNVPSNVYGFQNAADSNAYIGMIAYAVGDYQQENVFREPAGTQLVQPLIIGETYYLSYKVSLTLNNFESGGACNKLGAKLSTVPYSSSNPAPVNNIAHVYSDSIISDSTGWTIVSGSFVADSAYTFLSIGNFFDSTYIQYIDINGLWYTETAYYYVDDVKLSTDSSFVLSNIEHFIEPKKQFSFYPNPTTNHLTFDVPNNKELSIIFYNSTGELVLKRTIQNQKTIDVSQLSKGIYFVKIQNEHFVQKLFIH